MKNYSVDDVSKESAISLIKDHENVQVFCKGFGGYLLVDKTDLLQKLNDNLLNADIIDLYISKKSIFISFSGLE